MTIKALTTAGLLFFFIFSRLAVAAQRPDSLSVKIGQMLMIGFRGTSLDNAPEIAAAITRSCPL